MDIEIFVIDSVEKVWENLVNLNELFRYGKIYVMDIVEQPTMEKLSFELILKLIRKKTHEYFKFWYGNVGKLFFFASCYSFYYIALTPAWFRLFLKDKNRLQDLNLNLLPEKRMQWITMEMDLK